MDRWGEDAGYLPATLCHGEKKNEAKLHRRPSLGWTQVGKGCWAADVRRGAKRIYADMDEGGASGATARSAGPGDVVLEQKWGVHYKICLRCQILGTASCANINKLLNNFY